MIEQTTKEYWQADLRCPDCEGRLSASGSSLDCVNCKEKFPVLNGVPRLISSAMRHALAGETSKIKIDDRQVETAKSFGFEWTRFPEMHAEWERNFLDYFSPHGPETFHNKTVLDAGCGNGRHAYYAAKNGAKVWAVDLSSAVEVAQRNNAGNRDVHVIQADLRRLPFKHESFDLVYSI